MKKILATALALLMLVSLAACGNNTDKEADADKKDDTTQTDTNKTDTNKTEDTSKDADADKDAETTPNADKEEAAS